MENYMNYSLSLFLLCALPIYTSAMNRSIEEVVKTDEKKLAKKQKHDVIERFDSSDDTMPHPFLPDDEERLTFAAVNEIAPTVIHEAPRPGKSPAHFAPQSPQMRPYEPQIQKRMSEEEEEEDEYNTSPLKKKPKIIPLPVHFNPFSQPVPNVEEKEIEEEEIEKEVELILKEGLSLFNDTKRDRTALNGGKQELKSKSQSKKKKTRKKKKKKKEEKPDLNRKLLMAANRKNGTLANFKKLVDEGASIEARDSSRKTPLIRATAIKRFDICTYLLKKGARVNATDAQGNTPLLVALSTNNLRLARLFLDYNASVNIGNGQHTPLSLAASLNNLKLCTECIKKGANVNTHTPLAYAIQHGNEDLYNLLLEHGADVNHDSAPLGRAAQTGNLAICCDLVARGALVNPFNSYPDQTPLALAAQHGFPEICIFLLDKQAYITPETITSAVAGDKLEILNLLLEQWGPQPAYSFDNALALATENNQLDQASALIRAGADVNSPEQIFLHLAASYGHEDMCRLLVEAGASVNKWHQQSGTPLITAVRQGSLALCQFFISKGAYVNISLERGITPLHIALEEGHAEIAYLLIANGAYLNRSTESPSPLYTAAVHKNQDVCQYLLQQGAHLENDDELIHILDTAPSTIANLLLAYTFLQKIQSTYTLSQKRILSALCLFKRYGLPKNMGIYILSQDDTLQRDVAIMAAHRILSKRSLPLQRFVDHLLHHETVTFIENLWSDTDEQIIQEQKEIIQQAVQKVFNVKISPVEVMDQ